MKVHLITCDKTSRILRAFAHQAKKYFPEDTEFVVLGYSVFPELPDNYKIVSLAETQNDLHEWSRNLFDYFNGINDEYIITSLDDFLPTRKFDEEIFENAALTMFSDFTIGRYEIGIGHSWHGAIAVKGKVYYYGPKSLYRISTQMSVWRRSYLLKYLNNDWTPWEFELEGSKQAVTDGMNIIASSGKPALEWVANGMGALSNTWGDKINVTGMIKADIEEMVEFGIFNRKDLIVNYEK